MNPSIRRFGKIKIKKKAEFLMIYFLTLKEARHIILETVRSVCHR